MGTKLVEQKSLLDRAVVVVQLVIGLSDRQFLVAVTVFAACLRLFQLGEASLWLDEAVQWWIAQGSVSEVIAQNASQNSAAPLYPVFLSWWQFFGDQEWVLRLPSAFFGIAAVPLVFLSAQRLVSRPVAMLATVMLALSPEPIRYAQELREYSAALFLAFVIVWLLERYISEPRDGTLALLSLSCCLAMGVQYGTVFLVGGVSLTLLVWSWPNAKALLRWTGMNGSILGMVVMLYFAGLRRQMGGEQTGGGGWGQSGYLSEGYLHHGLLGNLWRLVRNTADIVAFSFDPGVQLIARHHGSIDHPVTLVVLACAVVASILWAAFFFAGAIPRSERTSIDSLTYCVGATFGLLLLAVLLDKHPYIGTRHTIFLVPLTLLGATRGIERLGSRGDIWRAGVAGSLLFVMAMVGLHLALYFSDIGNQPMRQALTRGKPPEGSHFFLNDDAVAAFRYYERGHDWYGEVIDIENDGVPNVLASVDSKDAWLLLSHVQSSERRAILKAVEQQLEMERVYTDNGTYLYRLKARGGGSLE